MERAEDELERIMYRGAPPRKRVREAVSSSSSSSSTSNTSDDESEPGFLVPDEPPPPSPKPLLATMSSGKQVVVPRPNLPIALQDVIEFLHHFKIFVRVSSPLFPQIALTNHNRKVLSPEILIDPKAPCLPFSQNGTRFTPSLKILTWSPPKQ
jgi:hypothetical protein